jgi:hypothetical protein
MVLLKNLVILAMVGVSAISRKLCLKSGFSPELTASDTGLNPEKER